ncbi:HepT-like ribonuclease domain-containing protein [Geoalkalibacter sp.]|uniref:HepT-like ribonuclease domain-containing protein n=1 Tax=Geoalkalibacter sp. TaxID=3041440 RepID=UPI00272DE383|nr:HepT-like ribonuclease domain-containing protein [Geoalkalibacter sp.]
MKDNERDAVLIEYMLECIARIEKYLPDGRKGFFGSELARDAVVRNLQTLAESSQRLSDECKKSRPEIDWRAMSGFRNILVHDYLGLDLKLIWLVIENELPLLKKALEEMEKS